MYRRVLILILIILTFGLVFPQEDLEDLSLKELLDVNVVSPTQKALRINRAPSVIRVITAEQIQINGYRSVGEAIMSIPGIYTYFDGVNYIVNVRGITGGMRGNNRIIKVMINNQPVSFSYNGGNFLGPELIPIETIQRIEVVLGPGSTLYGADPFLGIINIITKTGDDFDGGNVSLALGTENSNDMSFGGNCAIGQKLQHFEYMASVSGFGLNRTGLKIPETSIQYVGGQSENDVAHPYSFFTKLSYAPQNVGIFTLDGSFQYLDSYDEFADWGILTHNNRISLNNYFARMMYEKNFAGNLYATAGLSFLGGGPNGNDELDYGSDVFTVHRDMGFMNIDFKGQIEYSPSEKISVAAGTNVLSQNFNVGNLWYIFNRDFGDNSTGDSVTLQSAIGDTVFLNMGIYTQAIYIPSEKLNFTQGLIFSHNSTYGDFYNIRFGTVYNFTDQAHCKLLFGTSFSPPAPEQLFARPMFSGDAVGNPNLVPEESKNFDLEITPSNTEDFGASFDMFYNSITNKIGYVYRDGMFSVENLNPVDVMGGEAMLRWNFKNLTTQWSVSYQYTKIPDNSDEDSLFDYSYVPSEIFEYPTLMSYSSFSYMIPQIKIGFSFEQRYIGERSASQSNIALNGGEKYNLPAYQILNLNLFTKRLKMFSFGKTKFSLSIRNLTNEVYIEPGHNGIDIPGIKRTLYFQVSHNF
ncbi:TonB-dependent receptor plug domain-containing protein [bacterium]|nr:TonB-dependent receptor plug domain-containing protein [bacterium]